MFVGNLNNTQQSVLLSLAEKLIAADGTVSPEELEMLNAVSSQCSQNVQKSDLSFAELPEQFSDKKSKSSLMLEIIGLAYADNEYHENEQGFVKEVASALSISSDELSDMESWVKRQLLMTKEAQSFMED